jgi:hypothetical protein
VIDLLISIDILVQDLLVQVIAIEKEALAAVHHIKKEDTKDIPDMIGMKGKKEAGTTDIDMKEIKEIAKGIIVNLGKAESVTKIGKNGKVVHLDTASIDISGLTIT